MDYQALFHHCLTLEETEKGVFPCRFSKRQLGVFPKRNRKMPARVMSPAGISFAFETEADEISFSYWIDTFASCSQSTFDFYENDVFVYSLPLRSGSCTISSRVSYRKRSPGKTKLEVFLPVAAVTYLSEFELGDYSTIKMPEQKILFMGDSITQGFSTEQSSLIYPKLTADLLDMDYLNQGAAGYIFDEELLEETPSFQPDVITVAYGTNDAVEPNLQNVSVQVDAFYQKLRNLYPKTKILAITPIWREARENDLQDVRERMDAVSGMIAQAAERYGCALYDGLRAVPHFSEFFGDSILHPNSNGFAHYAMNLSKEIKKLL